MTVLMTTSEMRLLVSAAGGDPRTYELLGLAEGPTPSELREGISSLALKDAALAEPGGLRFRGETAGCARALTGPERWLLLTVAAGEVVDCAHVVQAAEATAVVTPRAMGTFRVDSFMGTDADEVVGRLLATHLANDGRLAAVVANGAAGGSPLLLLRRDAEGRLQMGPDEVSLEDVDPEELMGRATGLVRSV